MTSVGVADGFAPDSGTTSLAVSAFVGTDFSAARCAPFDVICAYLGSNDRDLPAATSLCPSEETTAQFDPDTRFELGGTQMSVARCDGVELIACSKR
jgi:hypothetical protein